MAITAAEIKRGLRIRMRNAGDAMVFQAGELPNENRDDFILVVDHCIFHPVGRMNAAQLAIFLNDNYFKVVG